MLVFFSDGVPISESSQVPPTRVPQIYSQCFHTIQYIDNQAMHYGCNHISSVLAGLLYVLANFSLAFQALVPLELTSTILSLSDV